MKPRAAARRADALRAAARRRDSQRSSTALERVRAARARERGRAARSPDDGTFRLVRPRRPRRSTARSSTLAAAARRARAARLRAGRGARARQRPTCAVLLGRRLARSDARRSSSSCTATGARRRASTARAAPRRSRRSSTRSATSALRRADAVRTLSAFTTDLVARGKASSRRGVPGVHRLRALPRAAARAAARARRARSSSACSSTTRASTCSPRPGVSRRRACRTRELRLVGRGTKPTVVEELSPICRARRAWYAALDQAEVAARARRARRRSCCRRARRGCGASSLEAFCRGRPVVARARRRHPSTSSRDGENGVLVDAEDAEALADALVRRALATARWAETPRRRRRAQRVETGSRRRRSSQSGFATSSPP